MQHFKSVYTIITINVFLLIAGIFSGCKKNTNLTENFTFSKEGLSYIQFNPGKYFIYKDSTTLTTDSVVVTESLLDTVSGTENGFFGVTDHYTAQEYTLMLSKIGSSNTVWLSGKASSLDEYTGNVYLIPAYIIYTSGYLFRYPPDSTISTIMVEGKAYKDVILMANAQSTYYWAKGVGLIKSSKVDIEGIRKTYTLLRNN